MCKINKLYKPRSRKYIYQKATDKEFDENIMLKNQRLIESDIVDKTPKIFYLCNDKIGYKKKFDNQTEASKICGISQAQLSHMIKEGNMINNWYCIYEDSIAYKNSSGYQNMVNLHPIITIENIYTKEIKTFDTQAELRNYLGLNGHQVSNYFKTGHILMNQWKIIAIENKQIISNAA